MRQQGPYRPAALRQLLDRQDLPTCVAYFAGVAAGGYDLEIASMDPEAFLAEIETNLGTDLSDLQRARILAGQLAYSSDMLYRDLPTFIDFANLSELEEAPDPLVFNPASVLECSLAVLELQLIDPEPYADKKKPAFSKDILAYHGAILATEGAARPIRPLQDAIMPNRGNIEDPAIFEAVEGRTLELERAIRQRVYRHAQDIYHSLFKIPTLDSQPLVNSQQMTELVANLVGRSDSPTPT